MCDTKLVWGLFFVILGSVWIASNLGLVAFDFGKWWPLIFVFVGLSILFSKPRMPWQDISMAKEKAGDVDWNQFSKGMKDFGKTMKKSFDNSRPRRKR